MPTSPSAAEHAGRRGYVHEAELRLAAGTDERAPGGAVTVALCGHWEHEGPCRWPHNSAFGQGDPPTLRTVFAAPPEDEAEVRERIERSLRADPGWTVLRSGPGELDEAERALAADLARTPPP